MKRTYCCILMCCVVFMLGLSLQAAAQTFISSSVRYDVFYDDRDPESSGAEITVPLGIAYRQERFSLSLETAYASADVSWSDGTDAKLSGLTDMLLSASYSYVFPRRPIALLFGLDMSLPSGQATLSELERRAEAGESNDLFEVDDFGAGLNIGPSLGLLREFDTVALSIHASYIFNGEYDPTSEIPDDDLDPGDQIFLLGGLDWYAAEKLDFGAFLSYSYFGTDTVNGKENFREGQRLVFGGNVRINTLPVGGVISLQYTLQAKNEVMIEETLQEEADNSNGSEFFGLAALNYLASPKLTLRLQGDIRYYGESEAEDESGLSFSGKRIRYAAGPGFNYRLTKQVSLNGLFKGFVMNQDRDQFEEQDIEFYGANLDLGFRYVF